MRKAVAILLAVAAVLVPSAVAQADSTNLPGGTALSVEITSPADEGVVAAGSTTIARHRVDRRGGRRSRTTTIAYVLDLSGSANDPANVDCNGDLGNDSILDVREGRGQRRSTRAAANAASPVLNSGVATFSGVGAALDVDPAGGTQLLTAPGPNIDIAVAPLAAGRRHQLRSRRHGRELGARPHRASAAKKTIVFISDGDDTRRWHPAGRLHSRRHGRAGVRHRCRHLCAAAR